MPLTLQDVRDQYPQYNDLSDQDLMDGMHQKFYSDMSKDDFYQAMNFNPSGEFTKGLERGIDQGKAAITEAIPAYVKGMSNEIAGTNFDVTKNLNNYQTDIAKSNQQNPSAVPSISNIHSIGDLGKYIAGGFGEQVPSLAVGMLGGGVGGKIVEAGLSDLAENAGKDLTQEEMNKVVASQAADIQKGALIGAGATIAPQVIPEQYLDFLSKGKDDPIGATMFGALQVGLTALPQVNVLSKLLGAKLTTEIISDSLLKNIGSEALSGATNFGAAGAAGAALSTIADHFVDQNKPIFTAENLTKIIDGGFKGAVGGAFVGASASPFIHGDMNAQTFKDLTSKVPDILGKKQDAKPTLDTTVITPTKMEPKDVAVAQNMGLETESFAKTSPNEDKAIKTAIQKVQDPNQVDIHNLTFDDLQGMDNDQLIKVKEQMLARQKAIEKGQRTDTTFMPGDGEIVHGAPISEDSSLNNPLNKINITDNNALDAAALPPKEEPQLPKGLKNATPRFGKYELNFPSDLEKALYISTSKSKSKSEDLYKQWLKDNYGMTDEDIAKHSNNVKNGIKSKLNIPEDIINNTIDVSKYQNPEIRGNELDLPVHGDLNSDYVTPKLLHNNGNKIWGTEMLPQVRDKVNHIIDNVNRIANEVTGNFSKVKFFDKLGMGEHLFDRPVGGYQFTHMIGIALHEGTREPQAIESTYHELGHVLEENGFWSPEELKVLDSNTGLLKSYADKNGFLAKMDFDRMLENPYYRKELRANALGKAGLEYEQTKKIPKDIPTVFKKAFSKALNFVERMKNGIKGLGFKSAQDILDSSIKGKYKNIPEAQRDRNIMTNDEYNKAVTNMNNIAQQARVSQLVDEQQKLDGENSREAFNRQTREAGYMSNQATENNGKQLGYFGRYLTTLKHEGSKLPILGTLYESVNRRSMNSRAYMFGYSEAQKDYAAAKKDQRYNIHELADKMRGLGQKATANDKGVLSWEENGIKKSLPTDPEKLKESQEQTKNYMQLQAAYSKVIDDFSNHIRTKAMDDPDIKPYFKNKDHILSATVGKALASIDDHASPAYDKLDNLYSVMKDFDNFKNTDFSPRMRFGQYGVVVKDIEGNQIAFHTIENGTFNKLYNPDQIKKLSQELKSKYSDKSKYQVIGNGRLKSFEPEDIKPFTMSYDNLNNHIDNRYINLDMLSSLLHTTGADPKAMENMKTSLYNDIMQKGFKKRFSESKNIPGYSKDWDRVNNAYLGGAAHWLSGLQYKEELGPITRAMAGMTDLQAKKKAESFLDYVNTPQEDFQKIRLLNYVWSMDGNLSSTLVQASTLPTTTLGKMTGYDGNIINNMARLGKWSKNFFQIMSHAGKVENGMVKVDYSDDNLNHFIKKGMLNQSQASFIKKLNAYGNIRAMATIIQTGENSGAMTKIAHGASTLSRYLSIPLSTIEQMTRFATAMAGHEMFETNPKAVENAKKMLGNDGVFQAMQNNRSNMTFNENAAMFLLDEAHGVYGREGRPDFQKGAGGAIFFPFQTYPQHAIEGLIRDGFYRGAEGKRAMAATLGAFFVFSGLLGMPGAEIIKDLLEKVQENITGHHTDYDLWAREKIYDQTGSTKFAKFITHGFPRGYMGVSMEKRIGLHFPAEDMISALLGGQSKPSEMFGVEGSIAAQMGNTWNAYQNGDSGGTMLASMLPNGPANLVKAYNYTQQGLVTQSENGKQPQLLSSDEITKASILARAVGITSDQIATARENHQFEQIDNSKDQLAMERFKKQATNILAAQNKAQDRGDFDTVKDKQQEYSDMQDKMSKYIADHNLQFNMKIFNKATSALVTQRANPDITVYKNYNKTERLDVDHLHKVMGVGQ